MLKVLCAQAPVFSHTSMTVANVLPPVVRICICCWSYVIVSGQNGAYQKLNVFPNGGTVTVWVSVLSPGYGDVEPTLADHELMWPTFTTCGETTPLAVHG